MKKMCLLLVMAFALLQVIAQNKKGNWIAGASLASGGFQHSKGSSHNSNSTTTYTSKGDNFYININPLGGYYFTDRIVGGVQLNITYSNSKSESGASNVQQVSSGNGHYTQVGIGPFGRFYIGKTGGKGMPFAEINGTANLNAGYKGDNKSATGSTYTYSYKNYLSWASGVKFGYEHFLGEVIGLQYYIGYSYSKIRYDAMLDFATQTDYSTRYKYTYSNVLVGAGLVIHLNCDKKMNSKK